MIRFDGCNSIVIEFDDRVLETFGMSIKLGNIGFSQNSENECSIFVKKVCIQGLVYLKQDLGEEGIIQLEFFGNKVTLEEAYLDSELVFYFCDVDELLNFIRKELELICFD